MKKRILGLILSASLLFTGCIEQRPIDQYGYVAAIGFDLGVQLPYKITLMILKSKSGSEGKADSGFQTVTAECENLFEAIETLSASLPFQLDFARTSLIVISREVLAKRANAMEELMNISFPRLRIRDNTHLFVSLSDASEALKGFENEFQSNVTKLSQSLVSYSEETALIPKANLALMDEAQTSRCFDAALPLIGVTGDGSLRAIRDSVGTNRYAYIGGKMLTDTGRKSGIGGSAVMRGYTLAGILDGQNTQFLLMATGEFRSGRMRFAAPDGQELSLYLKTTQDTKRELTLFDPPSVCVTMKFQADVELPLNSNELEQRELEQLISDYISANLSVLFMTLQTLDTDAMGFGKDAIKAFSSTADWDRFDWDKMYPKLEAKFVTDVKLTHNLNKTEVE